MFFKAGRSTESASLNAVDDCFTENMSSRLLTRRLNYLYFVNFHDRAVCIHDAQNDVNGFAKYQLVATREAGRFITDFRCPNDSSNNS